MAQQQFVVSVLGCGIMGSAIARRARLMGFRTIVWDRNFERARDVGEGAEAVEHLEGAVNNADVVVTMLADASAVLSVMDEHRGLDAMKVGAAWVQMSTIGLRGIMKAQEVALQRSEVVFVDAPVSGTKGPAEQGKLMILASGDEARVPQAVRALFDAIGQRTIWLGPIGAGTRMKLVLNAWLAALMEGLAETLVVADTLGISAQQFEKVIEGGPLAPPWALAKINKIEEGKTGEAEFPLKWADKDIHLALEAVSDTKPRTLPELETIARAWDRAVEQGLGDHDVSAAYLALQKA